MAVSFATVRQLAGAFPGVSEALCYGTPTLYAGKTILARLWEDGETLALKVPLELREGYLQADPDTFFLTDHYRTSPMMLVHLPSVEQHVLQPLIEQAWRMIVPTRQRMAYDQARQQ
ncbi:MmcQ/YjbR family DNA-binding protein [Hymenobacter sediminis]|uniref:MmcQ/YjbR family DNA-binding protein n=1 Tax=Hymenobacter sediminis TaxID=2218621 RepID=UPI000DA69C52|nr:MmcQ/YjbR family DNA-binding protein [Hymenobacter sediminis]RPD43653.1 MmcQ/YjbR family DNA-binding protein [Hymenobacter sediminis]